MSSFNSLSHCSKAFNLLFISISFNDDSENKDQVENPDHCIDFILLVLYHKSAILCIAVLFDGGR